MAAKDGHSPAHDPPVIVFGALRSGTTLLRLMLDMHPDISNPGEMDPLFDHLSRDRSGEWRYDMEALANNWIFRSSGLRLVENLDGKALLAAFISQLRERDGKALLSINLHRNVERVCALFPDVKIVRLLRDPRDVARSSIAMGWAGTCYHGVGHWIRTEDEWEAAWPTLPADRWIELRYESLVTAPEEELSAICAFLGVDYKPAMLTYDQTSTYAPVDPSLQSQWRRKSTPVEIAEVEARIGPRLGALGYAPSGYAPARLSLWRLFRLSVRDRLVRARFGVRRYGWPLYLSIEIAARGGPRSFRRRVFDRKASVDRRLLK